MEGAPTDGRDKYPKAGCWGRSAAGSYRQVRSGRWPSPFSNIPAAHFLNWPGLVDSRDDAVANNLLVLDPVVPVLAVALFVVSAVPVNQENCKIHNVEVGDGDRPAFGVALNDLAAVLHNIRLLSNPATGSQNLVTGNTGGKAVRPRLDPITEIVDVASYAPPARCQELAASLGLDELEVGNLGVVGVVAEVVLFQIGRAEDVEAGTNKRNHGGKSSRSEGERVVGEVPGLLGIDKGNPDEVTKGQHHTEAIRGDVHGCEDGGFKHPRVDDIESLDDGDADDTVCDVAKVTVLLSAEGAVENDPAHHTRTQLAPFLDVDFTNEGNGNARVQFTANEPIVEQVPGVAARSKLAVLRVASLDTETAHIHKGGKTVGNDDAGSQELDIVFADEDPDRKVGSLRSSAGSEQSKCQCVGVESYMLELVYTSVFDAKEDALLKRYLRRPPEARTVPSTS